MNKKGRAVDFSDTIAFTDPLFKVTAYETKLAQAGRAFHEEVEIKYCYEGTFNILINSEIYTVQEGDVVITNPYELHENVNIGDNNARYYMLIFNLDVVNDLQIGVDLRRLLIVERKKFKNIIRGNERLRSAIRNMAEERREKKEFSRVIERGLLEQIIALLLRENLQDAEEKDVNVKTKETIVPALSAIHNEYNKKLTVEYLAGLCFMSVSSFLRAFKLATGSTPITYVTAYRISVAEKLLQSTRHSCEEIALLCGFEDAAYFNKRFKKFRGQTPNKTRK